MMNSTDCDVRFSSHARQIARVNEHAWMRPRRPNSARIPLRARLGTLLITLGARLMPASATSRVDLVHAGDHAS